MNLRIVYKNLISSFVVFLIAVPLSLGIAQASGAPVQSAIVSAIIGGIVVGIFSGAPLQVSGPAAGLSVMVFEFVQRFGFQTTCLITAIAGIGQIILGLLKVSQVTLHIAPGVIHGMLAGIGVLIALGQTHVILGFKPFSSGLLNALHLPEHLAILNPTTTILGLSTIAILVLWNKYFKKLSAAIPGSLIAVLALSLFTYSYSLDVLKVQLDTNQLMPKLIEFFPKEAQWNGIIVAAISLMAVASAESLLCAIATDQLHSQRKANLDKELRAQGIGNFLSGLFGGLPISGVIVRSAANISSGATNRASSILHGCWILAFLGIGAHLINLIPLCVLAGLLVYVGVSLVKPSQIRHLISYREHYVYFATMSGVIIFGLLQGIAIGIALTIIQLLFNVSKFSLNVRPDNNERIDLDINGSMTFLNAPLLAKKLSSIPDNKKIRMTINTNKIDLSAIEVIRSWKTKYERQGGKVEKPDLDTIAGVQNNGSSTATH